MEAQTKGPRKRLFAERRSNRLFALLLGADADGLSYIRDKDFSVANLAGSRDFDNRVHRIVQLRIHNYHFDLQLRKKVDGVFAAPVDLRVPLLPAKSFRFGYR